MAIDATAALSRTRVGVHVVLRLHGRSPHERQTTNNALATHTHANHLQRPNSKDPGTHCRSGLLFAKGVEAPERSYASLAYTICTATANLQLYRLYGYLSCGLRGKDLPAKATLGSSSRARSGAAGCA